MTNNKRALYDQYEEEVYPLKNNEIQSLICEEDYFKHGVIFQYTHLYVILNKDSGLCKIGITNNVKERLRTLTNQSGCDLHLLFDVWFECLYDESNIIAESYLHKYFKDKRKSGEWFSLSPRDLVLIRYWADNHLELYYYPLIKK